MQTRLLKTLAVTAFGMMSFPLMLTNDVLAFGDTAPLRLLIYYAIFLAVFALGYLFGHIEKAGKLFLLLGRLVGCGTFFLSAFLINFTGNIVMIGAFGASAVLWFFLGERAVSKHYADYFPMFAFGVYVAVAVVCYLFYGAVSPDELRAPVQDILVITFMGEICLTALLANQSGIYDKASRRRETKAMLPKGLSGYNAALVLIITVAGSALYIFKDEIIWIIAEFIKLIVSLFIWLINLFYIEEQQVSPGNLQPDEEAFSKAQQMDITPIYILFIILVIIFRKAIWNGIKSGFKMIYDFLTRKQEQSGEEPDFIDHLEQAQPKKRVKGENMSDSALRRKYRAESSPGLKYRLGYRLLLRRIDRGKGRIKPSDTAESHLEKGIKQFGEPLCGVVDCYNEVRYNNVQPDKERLKALDTLLEEK